MVWKALGMWTWRRTNNGVRQGYTYPLEVRNRGYESPQFAGIHALNIYFQVYTPWKILNVLSIVVSAVNFIGGQALNHRLFKVFCNKVGAKHIVLLYHTEVRWLSRIWVLTCVFLLRKEIEQFLRHRNGGIAEHFKNEELIMPLAYLSDIFNHLSDLNTSIPGTVMNMITARETCGGPRITFVWRPSVPQGNLIQGQGNAIIS